MQGSREFFKCAPIVKDKERLRDGPRFEENRVTWQLSAVSNPGLEPREEEDGRGTTGET